MPDFTFFATSEAVSLLGAEPVFCDVLADTFNLDPESLRAQVRRAKKAGRLKPRAVIAVDLYGLPADYPAIEAVCREEGLILIEDAAQGFGGELAGRKACGFGKLSCTSFFPAKPLAVMETAAQFLPMRNRCTGSCALCACMERAPINTRMSVWA